MILSFRRNRRIDDLIMEVARMSAALDALTAQIATLEADESAIATAVGALVTEITDLNAQVEALKANSGVSDAEIQPLVEKVEAIATTANGVIEAAKAAPPAV